MTFKRANKICNKCQMTVQVCRGLHGIDIEKTKTETPNNPEEIKEVKI